MFNRATPILFKAALVLGFIAVSSLIHGTSALSSSDAEMKTCRSILEYFLSFSIPDRKISDDQPITPALVEDADFLDEAFEARLRKLSPAMLRRCRQEALTTRLNLEDFFKRRLLKLAKDPTKLGEYYVEASFVQAQYLSQKFQDRQREVFKALVEPFGKSLLMMVSKYLIGTEWEIFTRVPVRFAIWDATWSKNLGHQAVAAVQLETHVIALSVLEAKPTEMLIHLFHELAHLNDPQLKTTRFCTSGEPRSLRECFDPSHAFKNEVFAWDQTFKFIQTLRQQSYPIPTHFKELERKKGAMTNRLVEAFGIQNARTPTADEAEILKLKALEQFVSFIFYSRLMDRQ